MKTLNRTMLILIAGFFLIQIVYANTTGRDVTVNLAQKMINEIKSHIVLTDSQQQALLLKANAYESKYRGYKTIADSTTRNNQINEAYIEYRNAMELILSPVQKDSLAAKRLRKMLRKN